jgi:hypothetical protein
MAQIALTCRRLDGRAVDLLLPADDVIAQSLHVNKGNELLPTLVSVEAVIGVLANNGLVLADMNEITQISKALNKRFLAKAPADWKDTSIDLRVDRARPEQRDGLSLVQGLRTPTVQAANAVLDLGPDVPLERRRTMDEEYVREVTEQVQTKNAQWSRYFDSALSLIARTALQHLTVQLVGVPIVDIVRPIVRGAFRRVGD